MSSIVKSRSTQDTSKLCFSEGCSQSSQKDISSRHDTSPFWDAYRGSQKDQKYISSMILTRNYSVWISLLWEQSLV